MTTAVTEDALLPEIRRLYAAAQARIAEGNALKAAGDLRRWSAHTRETLALCDELDALIEALPEPPFALLDRKMAWRFKSVLLAV